MDEAEAGPSGLSRKGQSSPNVLPSSKKKRPKQNPLSASEKQVVLNIHKLVLEMWPKDNFPSKVEIVSKTAATAGISKATVYNILKEKKTEGDVQSSRPRQRKPYKFDNLDEKILSGIRRKVHNFFFNNEIPTLDKILAEVNNDDSLPNISRSTLHKVLSQKLKFKYAKRNRKSALIDRNEIVLWIIHYLSEIRKYRNEGKNICYLDETWATQSLQSGKIPKSHLIELQREGLSTGLKNPTGKGKRLIILHIGSSDGFVDGGDLVFEAKKEEGDYHSEMDAHNFEKWFSGLSNKIPKGSVIVIDNAPYHSRRKDQIPTTKTKKADIQNWLREKDIPFDEKEVRAQLLAKVKEHKHLFQSYVIDEMAKEMGFTVLRLPPYHCELNPIELIWSQVKGYIAKNNKDFKRVTLRKIVPEAFSQITASHWMACIEHVIKEEQKILRLDTLIDHTIEKFVINVSSDSSYSSEDE